MSIIFWNKSNIAYHLKQEISIVKTSKTTFYDYIYRLS